MAYTLVPTELIVDGAITSAKLDTNIAISGTLGVTGEVTLATHLIMGDNDKIKIGTGGDLEIYHDGSNSYISNSTGNIYLGDTNGAVHIQAKLNEESIICAADGAVTLYHDNAAKLATSSAGVTVTGTLAATLSTAAQPNITSVGTLTGLTTTGDINFGDNDKAVFGAGSDLQIYHDGTRSYVDDIGAGSLWLRGGDVAIKSTASENMADFANNGAVTLYYDNAAKIATTSTGIDVTGTAVTDGLTATGVIVTEGDAAVNDAQIGRLNFTNTNSNASSNPIRASILSGRQNSAWGGYLSLYTSTGTDAASEKVRIGETGNVGIGTSSPATALEVKGDGSVIQVSSVDYDVALLGRRGSSGVDLDKGYLRLRDTGVTKVAIDSAGNSYFNGGNVGIGISSPSAKLDVYQGELQVTGTLGNWSVDSQGAIMDFTRASTSYIRASNAAGQLMFQTGGSNNRMIINSSGNVGIGSSSPVTKLHIKGSGTYNHTPANTQGADFVITSSEMSDNNAHSIMQLVSVRQSLSTGSGSTGYLGFSTIDDSNGAGINDAARIAIVNEANAVTSPTALSFWTNTGGNSSGAAAERMRLNSVGILLLGMPSITSTVTYGGVYIAGDYNVGASNDYAQMFLQHNSTTNHGLVIKELGSSGNAILFLKSTGHVVGSITTTNSATAYNTSSDYRLKENVDYDFTALDRVAQLKPARFNFIADGDDTTVDGFLAHEVQDIVPEAITGEKDAVDDEGNPEYQGIDQSKLVPLLTKAIQEQQAIIDDLKSRIETLEG